MHFGLNFFTRIRLSQLAGQIGKQQQQYTDIMTSSSMTHNGRDYRTHSKDNHYSLKDRIEAPRKREPVGDLEQGPKGFRSQLYQWESRVHLDVEAKKQNSDSEDHRNSQKDHDWRHDGSDIHYIGKDFGRESYPSWHSSKYRNRAYWDREESSSYSSRNFEQPSQEKKGESWSCPRSRRRESSMDWDSPSRGYLRRAYRPAVVLSDDSGRSPVYSRDYSTRSPVEYRDRSKERYRNKEREGSRERIEYREQNPGKDVLRSKPRQSYNKATQQVPSNYPTNEKPPKPLPLLVLDLNGTLVYRMGINTSDRSKQPVLRPYLKSFLQYCLDVHTSTGHGEDQQRRWKEWEASKSHNESNSVHGGHFWKGSNAEPQAQDNATFRLLLWSSAQPHNVDSMARAILTPEQAEQLLRVYARDTLVTKQLYHQKAPSIKDLEILWAVLNNDKIGKKAEARLFAETRDQLDRGLDDTNWRRGMKPSSFVDYSEQAAKTAQENVVLPKRNKMGFYLDGFGYGQHNTLLLDDSVDKAKLQPFNHVLLPEFDRHRANKVLKLIDDLDREGKSDDSLNKSVSKVDNVLLQFIGVLEHARYQVNVSSWIRFGGLGNFGGVGQQHPYYLDEDDGGISDEVIKEAFDYFSTSTSSPSVDNLEPHLHKPTEERTEEFWAQEGKRALKRHGISLIPV